MSYRYIDTDTLLQPLLAQINLTPTLYWIPNLSGFQTYFPKLGLLQLHLNAVDYLIDPLVCIIFRLYGIRSLQIINCLFSIPAKKIGCITNMYKNTC